MALNFKKTVVQTPSFKETEQPPVVAPLPSVENAIPAPVVNVTPTPVVNTQAPQPQKSAGLFGKKLGLSSMFAAKDMMDQLKSSINALPNAVEGFIEGVKEGIDEAKTKKPSKK